MPWYASPILRSSQGHSMATLSMDLRQRILAAYDAGEGTRQDIAERFRVSLGMVKKLLQQRRSTGEIGARHHLAGRKPKITPAHRERLADLVHERPDRTLVELREGLGLDCSLVAIHYALQAMNLSLKKRRSTPPNSNAPMSASSAKFGKKK